MKYIKQFIFVVMLTFVGQVALAGVRFRIHNDTKHHIVVRFSGDNNWHYYAPGNNSGGHFNNGQSSLQRIEWYTVERDLQNWKVTKYVADMLNITEQANEDLRIMDNGKWTWSGQEWSVKNMKTGASMKKTPVKGTVIQ